MRTVLVHRADTITGPYEGRVALRDQGVAQGGLIDTPTGEWYAYLFQDCGAVGRVPYLVPVKWVDGWPVLGENGKVPDTLGLPASNGLIPGVVASDEFDRRPGDPALSLAQTTVHLKAECDFRSRADRARFSYSLDGATWAALGGELKMTYTLPHFMGYRFGLFNFATWSPGGHADFDYFRVSDRIAAEEGAPPQRR